MKKDLETGASVRSGYIDHYDDQAELAVWKRYKATYLSKSSETSEVVFRAKYVRNVVLDMLAKNPRIKTVVNIGCSYGWLESEIARSTSTVKVYGIDRSEEAMEQNRGEFSIDNLEFIAGDFHSVVQRRPEILRNAIVCHVNFGVYFLPKFLLSIYQAAFEGGAESIVLFEPSGISRQMHRHYTYSLAMKDSWVFRGPMLLNNYPALLDTSGFSIVYADQLKPPHPNSDFRSVCFVATRKAYQVSEAPSAKS